MSDTLATLILKELKALASQISPWITTPEMAVRYDCTAQTLGAMERRGEIPWRVAGRWSRVDVMDWESRKVTT